MATPQYGLHRDRDNSRVALNYAGTRRLHVDANGTAINGTFSSSGGLTVTADGLTVTAGGITVTAGGITVTAGVVSVDDTTDSTSAITGSIHTDGGLGVAKNLFLGLTLEAGADGVGASGEQLTSGGAAAECTWAAASSLREHKTDIAVVDEEADAALQRMLDRHVYAFRYDSEVKKGTGDYNTLYEGVMADEYPEVMHYNGGILNPINTFGETMLAIKALNQRIDSLQGVSV